MNILDASEELTDVEIEQFEKWEQPWEHESNKEGMTCRTQNHAVLNCMPRWERLASGA